ncbi:MAG: AAA family ATPase [Clostridia bacterium]|nr:AAA family ATPase [Clostridia bacterium]
MLFLKNFWLPTPREEEGSLHVNPKLNMQCYSNTNVYPFRIFPPKQLGEIEFAPITIFYGGNGSGKSTLLNVIAEKLELDRSSMFNKTPFVEDYLNCCDFELAFGLERAPDGSRIITSDDVFDFLLDVRAINEGVDHERNTVFEEYAELNRGKRQLLQGLDDLERFQKQAEARWKKGTRSKYTARRIPSELSGKSNGESAFSYFTQKIVERALYLLDEPENSLSATLQKELARFIEDSARFYKCQFVISTHSPFLLAMKDAVIYDLDCVPVTVRPWTELANVRAYYDFFKEHAEEF